MKKILVTGSNGFLGRALVERLLNQGHTVIPISSKQHDLTNSAILTELLNYEADFVFHIAGKVNLPAEKEKTIEFYTSNLNSTLLLLDYCRIKKTPMHYVSGYIYGPEKKESILETNKAKPHNTYSHSKWMAEELCHFYHTHFKVPLTISRPFNIYGIGQSADFIIPTLIHQIRHEKQIQVPSLMAKRDYIFSKDVANALIAIMEEGGNGEIYNIGTGKSYSCIEIINFLQTLMQTKKNISSTNFTEPVEILNACADITKITEHTSWRPQYTIEKGLQTLLEAEYESV